MRVWYPGPAVARAVAHEPQNHAILGRIVPGWNEIPEIDEARFALAAGLFQLAEPAPSVATILETSLAPRITRRASARDKE